MEQSLLPGLQIITCQLIILLAALVFLFLPPGLAAELWFHLIKPALELIAYSNLKMLQQMDHRLMGELLEV